MRELDVPAATDEAGLTDMVWANAERFGDAFSFRRRVDDSWHDVTAREFAWQVLGVAKGLIGAGLRPGDRVAVRSTTRYEASLVDFAIWTIGCAIVPLGEASSVDDVAGILSDSGAREVIVETDPHRDAVQGILDRVANTVRVWQIDGSFPAVDELTELGREVDDELVHRRRLEIRADDTAVLAYPAGRTDGHGTVLTHRDLLDEVRETIARYPRLIGLGNSLLVHLPPGHLFAKVMSLCCVFTRTTLGHSYHADDPLADLATFRPTAVVAGPMLLEQVYDAGKRTAAAADRDRVFDAAEAIAVEYGQAVAGSGAPLALRAKHFVAGRFIYPKLRVALGGRCVGVISVGPPLNEHLTRFFAGIGIPVYDGSA